MSDTITNTTNTNESKVFNVYVSKSTTAGTALVTRGSLNKTDTAPTVAGLYILEETGVYTNLGNIDAKAGKLNFASFDGTTWSLIEVDMLTSSTIFDKILDFSIAGATYTYPTYPTLIGIGGGNITRDNNITTITSSGGYVGGVYELGALTEIEMSIYVSYDKATWYVIGTDNSGAFYMVDNSYANKIYKVLPNGSLSTNWNIPTKISNYTPNSDKKILVNGNNIKIFSKENGNYILIFELTDYTIYGITKPAFGAVHYNNNTYWGSNSQISIKLLNSSSSNNWRLSPNTLPNVINGKQIVETNQFPFIGVIKQKSYAKTILYGDSISSTDYTWYKDLMTNLIGRNVYNAGFSGYTTAQLAQNTQLQRIFDFSPNLIIVLVGGNDSGAAGTVGSLTNAIVDGETIVSETDINANYSGTYYIQAVSHIIRKLKSYYPNFRVLANLTGTETEAEKHAKLLTAKENVVDILFLSGLPQQRNNSSNVYSLKENNERKRQAVIACCKKYNVNYLDTFGEMNIDMSVEPFWVSPTDKTNNKGVLTMDGLHPNYFGYYKLCKLIYKSIKEF